MPKPTKWRKVKGEWRRGPLLADATMFAGGYSFGVVLPYRTLWHGNYPTPAKPPA